MTSVSDESAYHEAGHALMAFVAGAEIQTVTIEPNRDDGPARYADIRMRWPTERFSDRELRTKVVLVALAGPVAESIYQGEPLHPGFVPEWSSDWQVAWDAASDLLPDPKDRLAFLEQSCRELHRLLGRDDHWAALAAVVDALLAHETLEGEQVSEILEHWLA